MTDVPPVRTTPTEGASLAESTLGELVEHANDLILLAELDGRLRYVNPAGRALLGLDPDEQVGGYRLHDLSAPGDGAADEDAWLALRRTGAVSREVRLRNVRTGAAVTVHSRSFALHSRHTGEPFAYAPIARDVAIEVAAREARELALAQQRSLLLQMYETQEWERRRVADEVHDDVLQAMAAGNLRVQTVRRLARSPGGPPVAEQLDALDRDVRAAVRRMRALLADLDPPGMEEPDLGTALRDLVRASFQADDATVEIDVRLQGTPSDTLRRGVFRLVREALSNARKHAQADRISVTVVEADGQVVVTVSDDGVGLGDDRPETASGGHGLRSMRQLAASLGGDLDVTGRAGHGVVVRAVLPARVGYLAADTGAAVRRMLEETLDGLSQGFMVLDRDQVVAWCNAAAVNVSGLRRSDLTGRRLAEVFDVPDDFVLRFDRALASGRPDLWRRWSENLGRHVELRLQPFGSGASVFLTDVTEEVERERFEAVALRLHRVAALIARTLAAEPDLDTAVTECCRLLVEALETTVAWVVLDDGRAWYAGDPQARVVHVRDLHLLGRRLGELRVGAWPEGLDEVTGAIADFGRGIGLRLGAEVGRAGLFRTDPGPDDAAPTDPA